MNISFIFASPIDEALNNNNSTTRCYLVEVRNANKESNDSVIIIHYSTIEKMFVFTPRHKFCFSTNLSKDFMMAQG